MSNSKPPQCGSIFLENLIFLGEKGMSEKVEQDKDADKADLPYIIVIIRSSCRAISAKMPHSFPLYLCLGSSYRGLEWCQKSKDSQEVEPGCQIFPGHCQRTDRCSTLVCNQSRIQSYVRESARERPC